VVQLREELADPSSGQQEVAALVQVLAVGTGEGCSGSGAVAGGGQVDPAAVAVKWEKAREKQGDWERGLLAKLWEQ
jgi:acetyl-CoA carboxylase carboxyltransferase component